MARAKIITFPMQKGGVGKTTTCKNVVEILGRHSKVLGIDNDQNADFTDSFISKKVVKQSKHPTTFDIYINDLSINEVKIEINENIDLVPSSIMLANVDVQIASKISREYVLKRAINEVIEEYDYIVIDCSPSLNITTINALVASDYTVYVTQLDYFSMQSLEELQGTVDVVKTINPNLVELGLILTMADGTNHVKEVKEELTESNYEILSTIDRATAVRDAIMAKQAIFQFEPQHKVSDQYQEFVERLVQRMEVE